MATAALSKSNRSAQVAQGQARGGWVLFLPTIPSADATARVKSWRRLQKVGAVALKNSVYVLPNSDGAVVLDVDRAARC